MQLGEGRDGRPGWFGEFVPDTYQALQSRVTHLLRHTGRHTGFRLIINNRVPGIGIIDLCRILSGLQRSSKPQVGRSSRPRGVCIMKYFLKIQI